MTNNAPGGGRRGSDPLPDDFDARLKRARESERPAKEKPAPSLLGLAFRLAAELVAGVVVGVFIGWVLDRWLGTAPLLLIVFFALGAAAGFINVFRTARQMNVQSGAGAPAPPVEEDDED